jgi:hypothetical protein
MLGTMPDAEVAAKIGRTANAVRVKRRRAWITVVVDREQRTAEVDE